MLPHNSSRRILGPRYHSFGVTFFFALRFAVRHLQLLSQRSPPARRPVSAEIPFTNTHNRVLHSLPSTPAQAYYRHPLHAGDLAVAPPESINLLALPFHSFGQTLAAFETESDP